VYDLLPASVDLPALEREVLAGWAEAKVFARSLEQTAGGPSWVFYEGPPTANGKPGIHHVEARVFKDVFPRYRTMRGYSVPRRAGWDCHGLPVELAVEKELGFTRKPDIESYGVAEFNARCRESVERHVDEFERLTERMGYWVDMSAAYETMSPSYVESVWWALKTIFDRGLLVQDHRVAPYCPRCGTALSDHEVAQGYLTVTDPSVYVRFPVTSGPYAGRADLLVWTTTPWTLISNTAVAVHPEVTYVLAQAAGADRLAVVAEPLLARVLGEDAEVVERLSGSALEHTAYARPFDVVDIDSAHFVGLADYVTVEDGTGLVHQAPAFGAEDLAVARRYGLPVVNPVRPDGHFEEHLPLVGGQFFRDADAAIVADLAARGLLLRAEPYEHSYPHCWRCDTALLYYALPSWYIRTTAIQDALLRENERTRWYPASIQHGRYGDWLTNNVDWALSRDRYWGTPLPIWRCEREHLTCVGSLAELSVVAGRDLSGLDPHRPFVDEVVFDCPQCGEPARRVPEVIDAWFDSGSMPFAQWGAPHRNRAEFEASYPAQFICEAIDQTRGWFYTLMAVGTLVFDRSSYETVLCLGHLVDRNGRKMSKHLGNVLDPFALMDAHGADAVRWFMLAGGSPWASRRVSHEVIADVVRKVLLTYWNTASFLTLYARANDWAPGGDVPPASERPALDRWALGELASTVAEVTAALDDFDTLRAGRRLSAFIDDLSNWYVRASRRRFWSGEPAALATLHECMHTLTLLLAPFTPFVTERVWGACVVPVEPGAPDSVHLASWPTADAARVDAALSAQMALVRRVVELGRSARTAAKVRTRQPLGAMVVFGEGWAAVPPELRALAYRELNVAGERLLDQVATVVDRSVKPNFRSLGRRFGPRTKAVAAALVATEPGRLDPVAPTVVVDGETLVLDPDDVLITAAPREGWAVATETGLTVALDTTLTPQLRRAGLAREAVRRLQEVRKASGLDVTDRVEVWWDALGETAEALDEHAGTVAEEVLAVRLDRGAPDAPLEPHVDAELGATFWVRQAGL